MQELPPESRRLMLSYYEQKGQAEIDQRRQLAAELGINAGKLQEARTLDAEARRRRAETALTVRARPAHGKEPDSR